MKGAIILSFVLRPSHLFFMLVIRGGGMWWRFVTQRLMSEVRGWACRWRKRRRWRGMAASA
jgi:hypothetical protein